MEAQLIQLPNSFQIDAADHDNKQLQDGDDHQVHERSNLKSSSPSLDHHMKEELDDELESAKMEMGHVREENERLKMLLSQIQKDYHSLQSQFITTFQQQSNFSKQDKPPPQEEIEEPDLVSLRLGRSCTPTEPKRDRENSTSPRKSKDEDKHMKVDSLKLGLDYDMDNWPKSSNVDATTTLEKSSDDSLVEMEKEEEQQAGETWPPSKALKTMRSDEGRDELSQQSSVKRARVSVRARCDTPTMNDGCQWRKYGQKIAKGNPCPRAYYRCTVAPACPVRKQVQRCADDMSILITTYEGTHNHPLSFSATAMASTTSAAASMLLSGSTSSGQGASINLRGLNFNLSNINSPSRPLYMPSTSQTLYPTITLDLTATNSNNYPSTYNAAPSTSIHLPHAPRFPSTTLNFSSSESNHSNYPSPWGNGYPNYGAVPYNKPTFGSMNLLGKQANFQDQHNNFYQTILPSMSTSSHQSQQTLTDTLTKAITSDPGFRSAVAAALSTINVDKGSQGNNTVIGSSHDANQDRKASCGPSYFNTSTDGSKQLLLQPSPIMPFSVIKGATTEADGRDQTK